MAIANEIGQQLHVKAVSGESLTAEEQATLDAWYAKMDEEESAIFAKLPPAPNLIALRAELDQTRAEMLAVVQRIQAITAENAVLRREIDELKRQLGQQDAG